MIENAGKLKGLSNEEIQRQVQKVKLIEDMSTIGTIMKEEILSEKKSNPENFYSTEEIIQHKSDDEQLYTLGIFSKILLNQGTVTAIKKNIDEDEKKASINNIQFLVNGMSDKKKYNLHFDFGSE